MPARAGAGVKAVPGVSVTSPRSKDHQGLARRSAPGFWWYWVNLDELPPGRSTPAQETAYSAQLAGKPADETLADLKPVLEALA